MLLLNGGVADGVVVAAPNDISVDSITFLLNSPL